MSEWPKELAAPDPWFVGTYSDNWCSDIRHWDGQRFACSRPKGHDGPHRAHYDSQSICCPDWGDLGVAFVVTRVGE